MGTTRSPCRTLYRTSIFPQKTKRRELDDKEIEIEVATTPVGVEIMAPPGMEEMTSQLQSMFQNLAGQNINPVR